MTPADRALMEHLQRLRDRSTMSQTEMARRMGVPSSYVSFWMNGERLPEDDVLERFVELLGGDLAEAWPLIQARDAKPVAPNRYVQAPRSEPAARRTTLRRSGPPRKRKLTPRRSERERDRDYLALVINLPCCAQHLGPCEGRVEADHAGRRPMGRKADDTTAIPLCSAHHRARTDFSGPFRDFDQSRMRAFLEWAIERTRVALGWGRTAQESGAVPW